MALIDPTGSAGYAFMEQLPAADASTIAKQIRYGLDGGKGGTYTPTAPLNIGWLGDVTLSGTMSLAATALLSVSELRLSIGAISDANGQTLRQVNGMIQRFATPAAARSHTLGVLGAGNAGEFIILIRPATGAFNIVVRDGTTNDIVVTLPASTYCGAFVYWNGANWQLGPGGATTAGVAA